jgi:hypothetical protein
MGGAEHARRVGVRPCRRLRRSGSGGRGEACRTEGERKGGGDEGLCHHGRILHASMEEGAGRAARDGPRGWRRPSRRENSGVVDTSIRSAELRIGV